MEKVLSRHTKIVRTHLFIGKPDTEENRKGFVSTIPLGRPSTPSDIANACCYLASDEANFITGVNLEVCVTTVLRSIIRLTFGLDRLMEVVVYDYGIGIA